MKHFRLLSLAATGIGIYFCNSFLETRKHNVFKIHAHSTHKLKNCPEPLHCEIWDPLHLPFKSSLVDKHPEAVTHEVLKDDEEFYVSQNLETGLPNWTLQRITKEMIKDELADGWSVKAAERQMKLLTTQGSQGFDLDPCVFHSVPPLHKFADKQNNGFYTDFYAYLEYLSKQSKNLYVCSGPVYTPDPDATVGCLSHFYKIILGENEDDMTWRFECYVVENKPLEGEYPYFGAYNVPRDELLPKLQYAVFPEIDPETILQTETEKTFSSRRGPSRL